MRLNVYKLKLTLTNGSYYYYKEDRDKDFKFSWWVDKSMAHNQASRLFRLSEYSKILANYEVEATEILIESWKEI